MKKFLSIPVIDEIGNTRPNTAIAPFKVIDTNFNNFISIGVRVGDIVHNLNNATQATVTAVDSSSQLSISDDIFTATPQSFQISRKNPETPNTFIGLDYLRAIDTKIIPGSKVFLSFKPYNKGLSTDIRYSIPIIISSTTTGFGVKTITDTASDFIAAGVKPGDIVWNVDSSNSSRTNVVSVDSATQLTLTNTICNNTGDNYYIYKTEDLAVSNFVQDAALKLMSSKWTENVLELNFDDFPNIMKSGYTVT